MASNSSCSNGQGSHRRLPHTSSSSQDSQDPGVIQDSKARTILPIPFSKSFSSASSISQRTPARSFSAHTSNVSNLNDPIQYSSLDVRRQTEELASIALNDPAFPNLASISSSTSTAVRRGSKGYLAGENSSIRSTRPDIIEEASEPVSPEDHSPPSTQPRLNSALTNMFRQHPVSSRRDSSISKTESRDSQVILDASMSEEDSADEDTPLFPKKAINYPIPRKSDASDLENQAVQNTKQNHAQQMFGELRRRTRKVTYLISHPKQWDRKVIWKQAIVQPIALLPCVFLGVLLNVLDGLSYGLILFPLSEPVFANTGPDGIAMFYVSCIVSQVVFSCGGSIFKGAVGSEMIEVVPFFHKMAYIVMARTGSDDPRVLMATVVTSYALSTILTGTVFFLLGGFKLGSLVNFFPRHILIGCIGGVGFFLVLTGIEVASRIDGSLSLNLETLKHLFQSRVVLLWLIPLLLAILLCIIKKFSKNPAIVPAYFITITGVFYIVVTAVPDYNLPQLRTEGWVFGEVGANVPFYHFYSYYDFNAVDWQALARTIPTMLALTFFGILHVPINVPALGLAAGEDDLDLNRELVAHGFSNVISGSIGSIQNYLVYTNSQMFIQNGGDARLAGILLAFATFGVLIAGPAMIGYVPIMVVGALIFYLGLDLLEEALWVTIGKMSWLEYLTIVAIVLVMGIYDFVAGILVGIILALLNFVVQTSNKSAIRTTYSGNIVESTVRRNPVQRHYLRSVGYQITVTTLSGYLFFGSIVKVEKKIRALIEEEVFRKQPTRFIIIDLAHVNGMDYSAAEAFKRIMRILTRRNVRMLLTAVDKNSEVGKSLRNVGLWLEDCGVEFFDSLNTALEHCENELLKEFYHQRSVRDTAHRPGAVEIPHSSDPPITTTPSFASPRQRQLRDAATATLDTPAALPPKKWSTFKQPLPLILQIFQDLSERKEDFWFRAVPYLVRREFGAGAVLFSRGDDASAFYLLDSGVLRASYNTAVGDYHESIVSGTTCGELPFFSETIRTATVVAERDCVVWCLERESWDKLRDEWKEGATELYRIAMKLTKERMDAVVSYVMTTAV